jgi:hypothetical protein
MRATTKLLAVAMPMVEGEILIAEGKIDSGIEQLRAAIQKRTLSNMTSHRDG